MVDHLGSHARSWMQLMIERGITWSTVFNGKYGRPLWLNQPWPKVDNDSSRSMRFPYTFCYFRIKLHLSRKLTNYLYSFPHWFLLRRIVTDHISTSLLPPSRCFANKLYLFLYLSFFFSLSSLYLQFFYFTWMHSLTSTKMATMREKTWILWQHVKMILIEEPL